MRFFVVKLSSLKFVLYKIHNEIKYLSFKVFWFDEQFFNIRYMYFTFKGFTKIHYISQLLTNKSKQISLVLNSLIN